MKLLLLTIDWSPIEGGIATLSEGTARALVARGHTVDVVAPRVAGQVAEESDEAPEHARAASTTPGSPGRVPGLAVARFPGYELSIARVVPFAVEALRRVRGHDGILAMNPAYGGLVATACRALGGPPYVAWAYGLELLKARGTPLAALYRHVFAHASGAFAISRFTAELLASLGVPGDRVRIVPPGVEPPATDPSFEDAVFRRERGLTGRPIVLTVARLIPRKGHGVLLEAMAQVRKRVPDVLWLVAGRGPCLAELTRKTSALGLDETVRFLGYVDRAELGALYRAASVFALTPRDSDRDAEGFGIVFLEAGLSGVPVVASRSGGVLDAVEDGGTGLLVAPDDVAGTAAAIGRLLADHELARRLGEGGLGRARASDWATTARAVEDALAGSVRPGRPA